MTKGIEIISEITWENWRMEMKKLDSWFLFMPYTTSMFYFFFFFVFFYVYSVNVQVDNELERCIVLYRRYDLSQYLLKKYLIKISLIVYKKTLRPLSLF